VAVATPVVVGGRLWGATLISSRHGSLPMDTERRLAEFTELVAIAIANAEDRAELKASRARIVAATDESRRQIERDLHDGVQQQLVSLAARLRRASIAMPADAHQLLERVAGEAEEAVFDLQELARGIFPSVLADQGLAAALRTQAARMPIAIQVEAEPNLAGRRFERELEAALYFVALEALANVQKHALGAAASVSLRNAEAGRRLVLEVHDDGPGFERRAQSPGTGLQNMRDRVAAIGGELEIDSRPGAGTWLRAEAPIAATVIALQPEADSLRLISTAATRRLRSGSALRPSFENTTAIRFSTVPSATYPASAIA
jgi:signal transduction histidine kinase